MDSIFVDYMDIIGTIVFAMSGTLTALNNKFDYFGALVIAFVTAKDGGTLRDLLLGASPVFWVQATEYFLYIFIGYLMATIFLIILICIIAIKRQWSISPHAIQEIDS